MLLTIAIIVAASIGLLYKFRERLAFKSGRLSRSWRPPNAIPIMGPVKFVDLSFGKVRYNYRSPSESAVELNIFVHGFSIPMDMWQEIFLALVHDNRACLVYDLYGRGWSDAPPVPMNVDLFVSQLAELLYALDLPYTKYNLFGVSMGGVIVQRFTELYPSKVARLVLCCSAGLNPVQPSKMLMCILSIPIIGPMLFKLVMQKRDNKSIRAQWAYPDKSAYQQYRTLFLQACKEHPGFLRSLFSTLISFDFQSSFESIAEVARQNIPILILWGDKDALIPVENARRYHKLYPNSSLLIIPGANHSLLIEHSEKAIEAIRDFLQDKPN